MLLARRHQLVIEFALLALVTYLAALGVSEGIRLAVDDVPAAPAEPFASEPDRTPAPLADYAVIAERDIFNPAHAAASQRAGALRLWGVGFAGREARAVIEDAESHRQDLYRVGDRVRGARVAAIDWDRVTLEGPGGEEVLELTTPGSTDAAPAEPAAPEVVASGRDDRIRRTSENGFIVDRRELAGALDGMSGLMTQLRAVAEVRDGRPAGFRLFQIRNDSLFARLGLRDGDVVQRVNGNQIGEPAALLGFLDRLKHEPRVALDIVRANSPRTLVYDLR
jgi:general secretion pathway protein C